MNNQIESMIRPVVALALSIAFVAQTPAAVASANEFGPDDEPLLLSLDRAIQIALENNYSVRNMQLSLRDAEAQIQGAFGQVMPSVALTSTYQRNLKSANPFAGSSAGNLFNALGSVGWLAYNEQARTDDDPATLPIPIDEFNDRQSQGLKDAGITLGGASNPFAVDNQFFNGITLTQTIYDGRALVAIQGAQALRASTQASLERQMQIVIHNTRAAYLTAILALENAQVVASSMERTAATLEDARKRVAQGVASKYQRLSAEVELSNLETQLIQAQNEAELALNNLKLAIGMSVDIPVTLEGSLDTIYAGRGLFQNASLDDAVSQALRQRPDLQQAELAIELQRLQQRAEKSSFFPVVSAFANVNYTGRVPDNRSGFVTDPDDPFKFSATSEEFFSSVYWNPDVNVGLSVSWTLFDGFQRKAKVDQQSISIQRRELEMDQLYDNIRSEVDASLRTVRAAQQRIAAQQQNVSRAELNYEFASTRLHEGVSSSLEERQASELLDQSRIGYLQAIHDYLVSLSNYYTSIGVPLQMGDTRVRITGR